MATATFLGTLLVFLLAAAGLTLGQWFGRSPISGSCRPRAGCGRPDCCQLDANETGR